MVGSWEGLALLVAVGAGVLWWCWWSPARRWDTRRWAARAGLHLTEDNVGLVRAWLARSRRWRMSGVLAGLALPSVWLAVADRPVPAPLDFALLDAMVGYHVGVFLAELTFRRPRSAQRSAHLRPRRLADYLGPHLRWMQRTLAGLAAVVVVLVASVPAWSEARQELLPASVAILIVSGTAIGGELLERAVVARSQPTTTSALRAADDAMRTGSVRALAASSMALQLVVLSVYVLAIGGTVAAPRLQPLVVGTGLAMFAAAVGTWVVVTRPVRGPAIMAES